jgi:hypothetical protein
MAGVRQGAATGQHQAIAARMSSLRFGPDLPLYLIAFLQMPSS